MAGTLRAAAPSIAAQGLDEAGALQVLGVDGLATPAATSHGLVRLDRMARVVRDCGPRALQEASARRSSALAASAPALLNSMARGNASLLTSLVASLIRMPGTRQLIDFDNKRRIFRNVVRRLQGSAAREVLSLTVRRDRVLEDVQSRLFGEKPDVLRKRLSVTFRGE